MKATQVLKTLSVGLFVCIFLFAMTLQAQEGNDEQLRIKTKSGEIKVKVGDDIVLETTDGDEISGTVLGGHPDELILSSKLGELKITSDKIKSIFISRKINEKNSAHGWRHGDPLNYRSFFSATGQTLKQGEKAYENYFLFFNSLNYGITDFITVNVGLSLFPSKNFIKNNAYMGGGKVRIFDQGMFRFTAGAQYIAVPFVKKVDVSFVYPYAVVGVGDPDNHQLNVSYSRLIYTGRENSDDSYTSSLNINGQLRLSNALKLVGETIIPMKTEGKDIISYVWGVRFMGKKIAVDLGFMNTTKSKIFPGIPMLSFCYRWE